MLKETKSYVERELRELILKARFDDLVRFIFTFYENIRLFYFQKIDAVSIYAQLVGFAS